MMEDVQTLARKKDDITTLIKKKKKKSSRFRARGIIGYKENFL